MSIFYFFVLVGLGAICISVHLVCSKLVVKRSKSSTDGKVTNITPVSLLEVKVTLPAKIIFFGDEAIAKQCDPSELAQLTKTRMGEGTLGTLFKVVLNNGSIITIRKIREALMINTDVLEYWINFFGGIRDAWLLPIQFSFWYGGEAFVLYEYLCLGSLEELLHGSEGIQFTPLSWGIRLKISLCAARAVASIHTNFIKNGESLICGVIKPSNVLIKTDFSACLSGYETPYLASPTSVIRRNRSRVAPELRHTQNCAKVFTKKSDVYSFGMLLLELITGKRPTVTNLREYVVEKRKKEGLKGIYDKRMGEMKESMLEMIEIGLLCLSRDPKERPSIDKVVQMIQGLQE